jgi:hypothetical protein
LVASAACLFLTWADRSSAQTDERPPILVADGPQHVRREFESRRGGARFDEVRWQIVDQYSWRGATVLFDVSPFQCGADRSQLVDVQLDLRILQTDRRTGWRAVTATDRTRCVQGDRTAVVTASSTGRGLGEVGVTLSFLAEDADLLPPGDYSTALVATVTAN